MSSRTKSLPMVLAKQRIANRTDPQGPPTNRPIGWTLAGTHWVGWAGIKLRRHAVGERRPVRSPLPAAAHGHSPSGPAATGDQFAAVMRPHAGTEAVLPLALGLAQAMGIMHGCVRSCLVPTRAAAGLTGCGIGLIKAQSVSHK